MVEEKEGHHVNGWFGKKGQIFPYGVTALMHCCTNTRERAYAASSPCSQPQAPLPHPISPRQKGAVPRGITFVTTMVLSCNLSARHIF